MIRALYWNSLVYASLSELKLLIEGAAEEDKFVVFLSIGQEEGFLARLKTAGVDNYIQFKLPRPISNVNYHSGRRLQIYILGKQPIKEGVEYGSGIDCTGKA